MVENSTEERETPHAGVSLTLTRPEADALLALLLQAPEGDEAVSAPLESVMYRLLKTLVQPAP